MLVLIQILGFNVNEEISTFLMCVLRLVSTEKEKHVGDASIEKANDKKHQGSSKSRKRGLTKNKERNLDPPGPIVMKPSSQTKKRVQLLQNQSSENFAKSTESFETAEKLKDSTEETVIRLNEHTSLNKVENMAPFFWLRDEDDEESLSQPADSDPFLDVTPVDVPSFSDLKDSDHESPSKVSTSKPNSLFKCCLSVLILQNIVL